MLAILTTMTKIIGQKQEKPMICYLQRNLIAQMIHPSPSLLNIVSLRNLIRSVIPAMLLLGLLQPLTAQEIHRTLEAKIRIQGNHKGEGFTAQSRQLGVLVDYESGDIIMRLDPSTLIADHDSLNRVLMDLPREEVIFDGNLGVDHIDPQQCMAPGAFPVEGVLMLGQYSGWITGTGHLTKRNSNDRIPCVLEMEFMLEPSMLQPGPELEGFHPMFQVSIMQAIMNQENY